MLQAPTIGLARYSQYDLSRQAKAQVQQKEPSHGIAVVSAATNTGGGETAMEKAEACPPTTVAAEVNQVCDSAATDPSVTQVAKQVVNLAKECWQLIEQLRLDAFLRDQEAFEFVQRIVDHKVCKLYFSSSLQGSRRRRYP
jgi:hypothetical protein